MLLKIKRILKWIPVLWNDQDWDSLFLLKIMNFKLKMMKKNFISEEYYIDNSFNISLIDNILVTGERVENNDYFEKACNDRNINLDDLGELSDILSAKYDKKNLMDLVSASDLAKKRRELDILCYFNDISKHFDDLWS